ncbi:MAG: hypothetical protein MJ016_03500 [Victivallaceae bacterium]|nr:hypothetical protein [Victivallaceae bacterium]
MDITQLNLSISWDEIFPLLQKHLPDSVTINDIHCSGTALCIVGVAKKWDFTLKIGTATEANGNRIGLVIKNVSLSHPDDSILNVCVWNPIKYLGAEIVSKANGLGSLKWQSKEEFVAKKIASGNKGISAKGNILYLNSTTLLKKFPLPVHVTGAFTSFAFTENGIELTINER